jgi:hypothetical protein
MKTKQLLFALVLLVICMACQREEEKVPPMKEFIIGKWQVIAQGHTEELVEPITPDGSYTEYFRDGTMGYYRWLFELQDYGYIKCDDRSCRMDEECLYVEFAISSESNQTYEYNYNDSTDLLTLKYVKGLVPTVMNYPFIKIHQRIKN